MNPLADIDSEIQRFVDQAQQEAAGVTGLDELEQLRVRYLGKKGTIKAIQNKIGTVPQGERKALGESINKAAQVITDLLDARRSVLRSEAIQARLAKEDIDISLPGIRTVIGRHHPISQTIEELKGIMTGLGFRFDDYPELETEFYNFDGLNTPEWHPARDLQGSFYTTGGGVLRTHTTAFQVHAMQQAGGRPPLRAFTAGRCYRKDALDASHSPTFHQMDVIAIDKGIAFSDLKWTLYTLASRLFARDTRLRFRPSYFPFTTPSAEVDISCFACNGAGCALCKSSGWIEILGSGMMRPEVLRAGGIDSETYSGFAFGMGVDRVTMLRHRIDDIRRLYLNEATFLQQF